MPGREGEVWVDVHADTSQVDNELERGLDEAVAKSEPDFKEAGKEIGDAVSDGIGESLKKGGKRHAKSIEDGLDGERVRVKVKYIYEKDSAGNIRKRLVEDLEEAASEAFTNLGRSGGPLSNIGRAIGDAVGAGFGVSGRSPLIALLIPLIGLIIEAVVGLLSVLQGALALLGTIPALLVAVGLQVGILMVAFNGVGTAIQGAFNAKNAKELREAIKGLTPAAQGFVLALLPLKSVFAELQKVIQQEFFSGLGIRPLREFVDSLERLLKSGDFRELARGVGTFVRGLAGVFTSPAFADFVSEVIPRTLLWLERFGPAFAGWLEGLIAMAKTLLPFLTDVGNLLSGQFDLWGQKFEDLAKDALDADKAGEETWIDRAYESLQQFFGLLTVAGMFIGSFLDSLNKAGGADALKQLAEQLLTLMLFFDSDIGQQGLTMFIDLVILLSEAAIGLIILFFSILGVVRMIGLGIEGLWNDYVVPFFEWIGKKIGEFVDWLSEPPEAIEKIGSAFLNLKNRIAVIFANIGSFLFNAGKNLLQGFIDGIYAKIKPLQDILGWVMAQAAAFFPGSPAKEGPFSGSGYSYYRGQALVEDFAAGMSSEQSALSQVSNNTMGAINFGPGSIRVDIQGATTPEQARVTGSAIGQGILGQLAARNTRLAVRTL
jgi:hypothetical protein